MKTIIRNLTTILLTAIFIGALLPSPAQAQKHVAKAVEDIRSNLTDGVIVSEKRNPQTKRIWKRQVVIRWNNSNTLQPLIDAIQKDVENSINYENIDNRVIKIQFGNGTTNSTYKLIRDRSNGKQWMLQYQEEDRRNAPADGESWLYDTDDVFGTTFEGINEVWNL